MQPEKIPIKAHEQMVPLLLQLPGHSENKLLEEGSEVHMSKYKSITVNCTEATQRR
jgi:hypothetical protein